MTLTVFKVHNDEGVPRRGMMLAEGTLEDIGRGVFPRPVDDWLASARESHGDGLAEYLLLRCPPTALLYQGYLLEAA